MSSAVDILQVAESGQAEELRDVLRGKCDSSLYFFAKTVMGYKDMTDDLHFDMCEAAQSAAIKQGFLVPRGHLKSTILTKADTLWRVCLDPEERILIVGESDTVAAKNLKDIKWHIVNNQILKWLYPEIIPPDLNATKWTDTEILLPRRGTYDESTITTAGIGAKLTGFHWTRIRYDDPFGEVAARSQAEAERVRDWIQYAPGLLVDPEKSCETWTGTRWKHGDGDIYGWIMENMPYVQWYRRSAVENGVPIWPERFSLQRLKEIEAREGAYKYACQYMNDPTPPEGADFSPVWIKYYHVEKDELGHMSVLVPEDGTPPVHASALHRMSFYDPSSGGRTAKCEAAIAAVGTAADGRHFVLEAWGRNCTYGEAIEQLQQFNDQYILRDNWYECVGAQKEVEEIVRMKRANLLCPNCQKRHRFLRVQPFTPPGGGRLNKEDRIRLYAQPPFEKGLVYIRQTHEVLRNQILQFPHSSMVDRFDALASALHLTRRPLSDDQILTEKQRKAAFEAKQESRVRTNQRYGGYC